MQSAYHLYMIFLLSKVKLYLERVLGAKRQIQECDKLIHTASESNIHS